MVQSLADNLQMTKNLYHNFFVCRGRCISKNAFNSFLIFHHKTNVGVLVGQVGPGGYRNFDC
jgi:hypothetical protein